MLMAILLVVLFVVNPALHCTTPLRGNVLIQAFSGLVILLVFSFAYLPL